MRFPVVKGPFGCKRLRQGDVLPDIAEVSEVRARHARTSLRSRYGFPPTGELRIRLHARTVPRLGTGRSPASPDDRSRRRTDATRARKACSLRTDETPANRQKARGPSLRPPRETAYRSGADPKGQAANLRASGS